MTIAAFKPGDQHNNHMTIKLTATEAKARFLSLLEEVASGQEAEITKHGRTVARLVPATDTLVLRGGLAGVAVTTASDEELYSTGLSASELMDRWRRLPPLDQSAPRADLDASVTPDP
jgi:prevent-host-death family protein